MGVARYGCVAWAMVGYAGRVWLMVGVVDRVWLSGYSLGGWM